MPGRTSLPGSTTSITVPCSSIAVSMLCKTHRKLQALLFRYFTASCMPRGD